MRINAKDEIYGDVTVLGRPMIFTNLRVDKSTVPNGLYVYEVRHDDDQMGDPVEIANWVLVNHWGTLISAEPIELPHKSANNAYRNIDPETDWNYESTTTTIEKYMERMRKNGA